MDGKTYAVPNRPVIEPRTMRQPSLPSQYRNAMWELEKAVRRLEKLHSNDRFAANRKTLLDLHLPQLSNMQVMLEHIEADLFGRDRCHVCDKRVPPGLDFGSENMTTCKACAGESR